MFDLLSHDDAAAAPALGPDAHKPLVAVPAQEGEPDALVTSFWDRLADFLTAEARESARQLASDPDGPGVPLRLQFQQRLEAARHALASERGRLVLSALASGVVPFAL
jgi:hypothetical protein